MILKWIFNFHNCCLYQSKMFDLFEILQWKILNQNESRITINSTLPLFLLKKQEPFIITDNKAVL
jgi:hypothetical protein